MAWKRSVVRTLQVIFCIVVPLYIIANSNGSSNINMGLALFLVFFISAAPLIFAKFAGDFILGVWEGETLKAIHERHVANKSYLVAFIVVIVLPLMPFFLAFILDLGNMLD